MGWDDELSRQAVHPSFSPAPCLRKQTARHPEAACHDEPISRPRYECDGMMMSCLGMSIFARQSRAVRSASPVQPHPYGAACRCPLSAAHAAAFCQEQKKEIWIGADSTPNHAGWLHRISFRRPDGWMDGWLLTCLWNEASGFAAFFSAAGDGRGGGICVFGISNCRLVERRRR